jgi:hypothetical protein
VFYFAQKAYRIPYEIKKLFIMILVGALLYLPVIMINDMNLVIRLTVKSALIIVYPFILYALGFFESTELRSIRGAWLKWRHPTAIIENIKSMKR